MTFFTSEAREFCQNSVLACICDCVILAPSAPELVSTNLKNNTMLSVFWREPKSPNGVLLEYQIIFTTHSRNEVSCIYGSSNHCMVTMLIVFSRQQTQADLYFLEK